MEKKHILSDFVKGDRFELNSYLTYLFDKFNADVKDHSKDKLVKQWIN
ncbi:hypothetical protein [Metabacillus elymi]|jgi:hypothetical protein|uniref:Uncharacterized protein n=1 Tax=Metabacillus elymi TaxID=2745198 RepID=A0ABX6S134_9BACI|nr:hypothetical protein [Metabacillus sp. KUDC1714]QNF27178.1 hypothetical protein HUW50_06300 [Metabacillus sp. KUDC1714]